MTGFLLTAKQKLMLCINKRLYWAYRTNRTQGRHGCNRPDRNHWSDRFYRERCDDSGRHRDDRRSWDIGSGGKLRNGAAGCL